MFDNNIKVHFAGSDGEEIFYAALKCADTKYRLYSCYKYIKNKKVEDDFTLPYDHVIRDQIRTNRHVIQDSGLFTLMFGAGKGEKQTVESLMNWQDKLCKFVLQNKLECSVVEIDCQKVLGVEEAWFFRKRMKDMIPNRIINVFHYEDGKDGLDKLIDFFEYIAVSVPEIRIVKPRTYKQDVCELTRYIKKRKPNIDIHLLGCTEYDLLEKNAFCTSADSTSWLSGVKYGHFKDDNKKSHIRNFKKEIFEQRKEEVLRELKNRNVELKSKTVDYCTNASICATICKQKYAKKCGNQD